MAVAPIGLADLLAELGDWAARVEAAGVVLDATSALHELESAGRLHGNRLGTGADAVRR